MRQVFAAVFALCLFLCLPACSSRQVTTAHKWSPESDSSGLLTDECKLEVKQKSELQQEVQTVVFEFAVQVLERLLLGLIERELNGLAGQPKQRLEVRRILLESGVGTAGRSVSDHLYPRKSGD